MKPCYFCHLSVSWPWAKITFNALASINGGTKKVQELAHPECCELAERLIGGIRQTAPMTQPFPFTFKP